MFTYQESTIKNYNKRQKQKSKVPLSLIIYFILNLFTGINLGYTKCLRKGIRPFIHVLQFSIGLLIGISLTIPSNNIAAYLYVVVGLQHLFSVFLFHYTKYNIYDLIIDINGIEKEIMRPVEKTFGVIISLIFVGLFSFNTFLCVHICTISFSSCQYTVIPGVASCILALTPDGIPIVQVLIHYYIFRSVKYLKQSAAESSDMQMIIKQYIAVADCYDRIMPVYGKLIIVELIVTMPRMMYMLLHLISSLKKAHGTGIFVEFLFIMHSVINFCVPAVIAEMTDTKVRDLRIALRNRIIEEKDEDKKLEVSHMLEYMESHHFHYTVCRVIPVDMQLIVSMLGICTTYFIVILQFTHLL